MTLLLLLTSSGVQHYAQSTIDASASVSAELNNSTKSASTAVDSTLLLTGDLKNGTEPIVSIILMTAAISGVAYKTSNPVQSQIDVVTGLAGILYATSNPIESFILLFESALSFAFPGRQYGATGITSGGARTGLGGTPTAAGGRS